jgi:hypothetical protein
MRKLALPVLQGQNIKPKTHELFEQIVPVALEFAKSLKWQAERRRRTSTATTGNGVDGFRLQDLLFHLYEQIPGALRAWFQPRICTTACYIGATGQVRII